jgi:hypothetical protein
MDLFGFGGVTREQPGDIAMKLAALLIAVPLALGSGAVMAADTTTTTESTSINSAMPKATESTTKVEHHEGLFGDKTVEKSKSTTQNADGTSTTEKSKKITND